MAKFKPLKITEGVYNNLQYNFIYIDEMEMIFLRVENVYSTILLELGGQWWEFKDRLLAKCDYLDKVFLYITEYERVGQSSFQTRVLLNQEFFDSKSYFRVFTNFNELILEIARMSSLYTLS